MARAQIDIQFQSQDSEQTRLEKLRRLAQAVNELARQADVPVSSSTPGEVITANNVGTGTGVFKVKTGTQLNFHKLLAGDNVSITLVGDDIVITSIATEPELEPLSIAGAF